MEKITVENFNDSLEKRILDRLVQVGATTYAVGNSKGTDSIEYKKSQNYVQALWELFRDEVLDKLSEEELTIFFNYENSRYETYSEREDENSKNIANMSNDMRYNFANALRNDSDWKEKGFDNLDEKVKDLASKAKK